MDRGSELFNAPSTYLISDTGLNRNDVNRACRVPTKPHTIRSTTMTPSTIPRIMCAENRGLSSSAKTEMAAETKKPIVSSQ
jgi:hypothetical protein